MAIIGGAGAAAEHPGHDLTYQAEAGLLVPPQLPTSLFVDLLGGERAASEGLAALLAARDSGTGCYREVALADAAHALAAPLRYGLTGAGAPLGGGSPTYRVYRTSDGHVALAAVELQFARRVGELLGPAAGWAELLAARPAAYWVRWAAQHDLPLVEVHLPPHQVRATPSPDASTRELRRLARPGADPARQPARGRRSPVRPGRRTPPPSPRQRRRSAPTGRDTRWKNGIQALAVRSGEDGAAQRDVALELAGRNVRVSIEPFMSRNCRT